MEKKRSKGVTIFAVLTIIFSLLSIIGWDYEALSTMYYRLPPFLIQILFIWAIAYVFIGLLVGIGLFRLSELARKTAIVITIVNILIYIFTAFFQVSGHNALFVKRYQPIADLPNVMPETSFVTVCLYITYFIYVISVAYEIIYIYFFTRPKVKEQFR